MKKRNYFFILIASLSATLLRLHIVNNLIISILGSFVFGFVIGRRYCKSINSILITGFCSCLTSFSGFIYDVYQLLKMDYYLEIFLYLNIILILNLLMMNFGFILSRKMN